MPTPLTPRFISQCTLISWVFLSLTLRWNKTFWNPNRRAASLPCSQPVVFVLFSVVEQAALSRFSGHPLPRHVPSWHGVVLGWASCETLALHPIIPSSTALLMGQIFIRISVYCSPWNLTKPRLFPVPLAGLLAALYHCICWSELDTDD